jgi:hypothetical protein
MLSARYILALYRANFKFRYTKGLPITRTAPFGGYLKTFTEDMLVDIVDGSSRDRVICLRETSKGKWIVSWQQIHILAE